MPLEEFINQRREEIRGVARRHGVQDIRLIGSVARHQSQAGSDIDLLVKVGNETSPWFPSGLILELQTLLGCRVDIVTEAGLNPDLREAVLRDSRPL